jgi:hypothetical protein
MTIFDYMSWFEDTIQELLEEKTPKIYICHEKKCKLSREGKCWGVGFYYSKDSPFGCLNAVVE